MLQGEEQGTAGTAVLQRGVTDGWDSRVTGGVKDGRLGQPYYRGRGDGRLGQPCYREMSDGRLGQPCYRGVKDGRLGQPCYRGGERRTAGTAVLQRR